MQDGLPPAERGIFLAGDDVSFTPAWVEGAVQTALNAVWGIVHQLGGRCAATTPGRASCFPSTSGRWPCRTETMPPRATARTLPPTLGRARRQNPRLRPCKIDLTLALWQTPHPASTAEALQRLDAACAQAARRAPTCWSRPRCSSPATPSAPNAWRPWPSRPTVHWRRRWRRIAQRHGIAIVYGYPEHNPAARPSTRRRPSPRRHAADELPQDPSVRRPGPRAVQRGDTASQVFEWRGWRLGLLICYDVEFPETVRGWRCRAPTRCWCPRPTWWGSTRCSACCCRPGRWRTACFWPTPTPAAAKARLHYNGQHAARAR
jgi:hypothetical protein